MSLALDGDSASIHTLYKRLESRMRKVKKQLQREMRNLNRSHTLNQHEDTLTHWAKSYGPLPHTMDPHDTREEPVRMILKQANDDLGWWESHLGLTVAPKYMANSHALPSLDLIAHTLLQLQYLHQSPPSYPTERNLANSTPSPSMTTASSTPAPSSPIIASSSSPATTRSSRVSPAAIDESPRLMKQEQQILSTDIRAHDTSHLRKDSHLGSENMQHIVREPPRSSTPMRTLPNIEDFAETPGDFTQPGTPYNPALLHLNDRSLTPPRSNNVTGSVFPPMSVGDHDRQDTWGHMNSDQAVQMALSPPIAWSPNPTVLLPIPSIGSSHNPDPKDERDKGALLKDFFSSRRPGPS